MVIVIALEHNQEKIGNVSGRLFFQFRLIELQACWEGWRE
jgi:hypothetical protein